MEDSEQADSEQEDPYADLDAGYYDRQNLYNEVYGYDDEQENSDDGYDNDHQDLFDDGDDDVYRRFSMEGCGEYPDMFLWVAAKYNRDWEPAQCYIKGISWLQ